MWEIVKAAFPEKQQKAIEKLNEKCPNFYDTYFVPTVQPKLDKVSFYKIKEVFTAGASASSFVESMNSSMGRWFLSSSNSFVEVITCCLQKDAQNIKEEQQALGIVNLNTNGLTADTDLVRACRSIFSDYITQKFQEQEVEATNYHAFVECSTVLQPGSATTLHITVKRKIITEAVRHIAVDISEHHQVGYIHPCKCPKYKNEGYACQHVLSASQLLTAQFSIRVCFSHIQHMFHKRYRCRTTLDLKFEGAFTIASLCLSSETSNDNDCVFEQTMQGE